MLHSQELSLTKIKVSGQAKQAEEQREIDRKRNTLVLIMDYLRMHGYHDSVERLQNETNKTLSNYSAADNIDLATIVQEFEEFYRIKFGKTPKLIRKRPADEPKLTSAKSITKPPPLPPLAAYQELHHNNSEIPTISSNLGGMFRSATLTSLGTMSSTTSITKSTNNPTPLTANSTRSSSIVQSAGNNNSPSVAKKRQDPSADFNISGNQITPATVSNSSKPVVCTPNKDATQQQSAQSLNCTKDEWLESQLLKPLSGFTHEMRELADIIRRDIFVQNPNVCWDDIAGLSTSKRLLKEAVFYPMKYPQLFSGILKPWKGILLYGPPGTGKTMLAKAVATECKTTFFNISASSIVSKWRGDSEKLVRVLFEMARYHSPSTIFLDELESLMSSRAADGEHEGSRRMKTELLIQMDGLAKNNEHVFLLAASNLPWELDIAMLRRLEKRILIGLPDEEARRQMFRQNLPAKLTDGLNNRLVEDDLDYGLLADRTAGYNGSDIALICKEAAMAPLRKVFESLDAISDDSDEQAAVIKREKVNMNHLLDAISSTKPSCDQTWQELYSRWQNDYGSI